MQATTMGLVTQLREAPGVLKWLPLALALLPLAYLALRLAKDLRAWRSARAQRSGQRPPALRKAWNAFVRRTPSGQRRALGLLQPFVVLGEAGSGKTTLIERYLDWRGHAAEFQPSHVDDPLVQLYRGPNAIVEELAGSLLEDASAPTHRSLERLWRPLVRGRTPEVLVVLDTGRLLRATTEQLTRRAQLLRGKLNLLAELARRPIKVTLVVTKVDQVAGFTEVAALLGERGTPFRVQAGPDGSLALSRGLSAFEELLPALLAARNAQSYLQALAFFERLPAIIAPLKRLLDQLCHADPLSPAPQVNAVALHASDESGGFDPFTAELTAAEVRRFRPLRKHAFVAGALASLAAAAMVVSFVAARTRIGEAAVRLDALLESPADPATLAAWQSGLEQARDSSARRLLPAFFARDDRFGDAEVRRRFVAGVRARLARLGPNADAEQRLYALTLLYAPGTRPAGRFIREHAAQWANALELPRSLVTDYIDAADEPPMGEVGDWAQAVSFVPRLDTSELSSWLGELQARQAKPFLAPEELEGLKRTAARARRAAERLDERNNLTWAVALASGQEGRRDEGPIAPTVARLADLLASSAVSAPDVARLDLLSLTAELDRLTTEPEKSAAPLALAFDEQSFTIDPAAWQRLLARSRVTLLSRAFVARNDDGIEALFAQPGYAAVTLTARGDGCGFDGAGRIEGPFTARAFADHVAPALAALPPLLAKLPLADDDREELTDRINEALETYAEQYADQYRRLLGSLRCRARSPVELRVLLSQLPTPSSPLRAALREISRNTALAVPKDSPYATPFDDLADEFAPLRALAPPSGPATQLDGWLAILRVLRAAVDGRSAPAAGGAEEPEGGLRSRLSPLGKLALATYRNEEDSPKQQLDRWLATANIDSDWWPAFSAPVQEAYALGRRELQKAVDESWNELSQSTLHPLTETFPFKRDAEAAATPAQLEPALMPKRELWTAFEAGIAPLLAPAREGWRALKGEGKGEGEGRSSTLLPADLLPTVNRLKALSSLLWDKDGKPKPLLVRVRPLPLTQPRTAGSPLLLGSFLQVGPTSVHGFNQHVDWVTVPIEWWRGESASVGLILAGKDGAQDYRTINVGETPWSFWRLVARATATDGGARIFTWQVPGPDGRSIPVQFELKDDPWTRFALR